MTVGKYRLNLPDVADGELCYLSTDSKGRLVLSTMSTGQPAAGAAAAWNGVAASTDEIALLKALHAQNVQMIALLTAIRDKP